jgi:hypothetical protein
MVFWRRISRQAAPSQAIVVMNQTLNGGVTAGLDEKTLLAKNHQRRRGSGETNLLFKRPSSPTAFPRQDSLTAPKSLAFTTSQTGTANSLWQVLVKHSRLIGREEY